MKKVVLLVLLIYVGLAHCVSYLILSSHWSVTSKVIGLTSFSFAYSSVGLLAILVWLGTWSTTRLREDSNRLTTLAKMEQIVAQGKAGTTLSQTTSDLDVWEELNEKDQINNRRRVWEPHGPHCDGYCCMDNPSNRLSTN